jgi:CPA1 family monovalent cation:H+ antiporter
MGQAELVIAGLLVAVAGLSALARRLSVPYPIVLVIGGALFGFVPGLPTVRLNPNIVLVVFLPPLLYRAAYRANLHDFRANAMPIALVSIGLVLVTMGAVAVVAHALVSRLPWAAAFTLGAIVSPTDPLAAAIIMRRLDVPRRVISVVEGEGLFNDATALVLYRVAVAAVVSGSFSVADAGVSFVGQAAGGVAIGLAVGWVVAEIRKRTSDAETSITISLLTPYAAFIPADALGCSGVLAVVTAGIYIGTRAASILPPRTRLQGNFVWEILSFVVTATLFVLVGLQLGTIVDSIPARSPLTVAYHVVAICGVVIATRLLWVLAYPFMVRAVPRHTRRRLPRFPMGLRLVGAWSGMRGAVSLAAALALPLQTDAGTPFPRRTTIQFLTFAVIFATLVLQGLSLPAVIRRVGVSEAGTATQEELRARLAAAEAAVERLDALADEEWTREETIEELRDRYEYRRRRFGARAGHIEDEGYEDRSLAHQQVIKSVLGAQREALIRMRDEGTISNECMMRLIHELDLEESRLEI